MNVRLIVPRRADGGHRDRLWDYCRAYWREQRPGWEIVEGEWAAEPFNRAGAINRAAEGDWQVGVILDADSVIDAELVEVGVDQALATGRLTLPYTTRNLLSQKGTRAILAGTGGSWDRFIRARQTPDDSYEFISSCNVIPRALWDDVGGFDERFEGWGGEDDAFHAACTALTGHDARCDRLEGAIWHLWHAPSPHANHRTATWKQARHLSNRYIAAAEDPEAMRSLLVEDRGPDQVAVVVLTTGTRDTLAKTVASLEENVSGPIGRRLICVDSKATDLAFPGWDVIAMGRSKGYAMANRLLHQHAVGSGQPWVFLTEDDFTFNEPVDLTQLQRVMEAHPELAQLSLMRQPWYERELKAGGVIAADPKAFTQREGYVEHHSYWTSNPMLCRRELLAAHEWPQGPGSEARFARKLFTNGTVAGIWGSAEDPPRVTHIGTEQAGSGY